MSGVLVVAEHLQGRLRDVTKELVTAARELGGPVSVAVVAGDPAAMAGAANLKGVDEVLAVASGSGEFESDVYQHAVQTLVATRTPDIVLGGFTVSAMGYLPAVAARLGTGFASDVFALARRGSSIMARRAFYGSKLHAEVELVGAPPAIVLLRPTVWEPAEPGGTAAVTEISIEAPESRARHLSFVEAPVGDVDITSADFLLSLGRGIGERDNVVRFERLAGKMGATLAVSRPLVDAGWMPSSRQVGQSGRTVKPKVYLAFGISGAVQHLAGMKSAGTIIAVNTDPEAAIFSVAHYGAVVDVLEVADELEKLY
ncbi:MAG: electron transfer flavoprotein subunit alpha/FixB family protein [Acidimicrobiales bacterium]